MNFAVKTRNFALTMVNFALKMVNLAGGGLVWSHRRRAEPDDVWRRVSQAAQARTRRQRTRPGAA